MRSLSTGFMGNSLLEELALALLDFKSTKDLQTWLEQLNPEVPGVNYLSGRP